MSEEQPWQVSSILEALTSPPKGSSVRDRLRYEPSGEVLVLALRAASTDRVRRIICDVLGYRHENLAVEALIEQLSNVEVRANAADALAKIGDSAAGPALLACLGEENPPGTRSMLAAALGAVRYAPAIPALMDLLSYPDTSVRGSTAWALGFMRARGAIEPMRRVLASESSAYAVERLEEAIDLLSRVYPEEGQT